MLIKRKSLALDDNELDILPTNAAAAVHHPYSGMPQVVASIVFFFLFLRLVQRCWRFLFPPRPNFDDLPDEMLEEIGKFLDVKSLFTGRQIARRYKRIFTFVLNKKKKPNAGVFGKREGMLRAAVSHFTAVCEFYEPARAETISQDYGWFMNDWDVSRIRNFDRLFMNKAHFNENISGWDTSRAISMDGMLCGASSFDQDLSNWNLASVQSMVDYNQGALKFGRGPVNFRERSSLLYWEARERQYNRIQMRREMHY